MLLIPVSMPLVGMIPVSMLLVVMVSVRMFMALARALIRVVYAGVGLVGVGHDKGVPNGFESELAS